MSYLLYAHFFVQKNVEVNMLLRAYPNIYYRTVILLKALMDDDGYWFELNLKK